jgi:hypothetical protein
MKFKKFIAKVIELACRSPDVVIGGDDNPYLLRWYVIPRNRFFNIYLHKFLRDDDDRAMHDHPWASCSVILKGGYIEHQPDGARVRKTGRIYFRRATQAHRIELHRGYWCSWCRNVWHPDSREPSLPAWSLFITGPKIREWGFHCPKGWVHWKLFCSPHDTNEVEYGLIGRGCE